ncbi:MAG: hypothetical protein HY688_03275 [Chloroflexi bacterium]|nr:hypothetical protein [Chloroflexota bacterium]
MSHIYAGQPSLVHPDVLEALKRLPRDFWVFAEFDVERNVDVLLVREVRDSRDPSQHSTLILTEVKALSRPIRVLSINGPWERKNEAGGWEEIPFSGDDTNHYRQAVNTSNALQRWLHNNQRFFLEGQEIRPEEEFKPWPDLLIISPPGIVHQLPLQNPTKFGYWFVDVSAWTRHLVDWQQRRGIGLTERDLQSLADLLRLQLVWEDEPVRAQPLPEGIPSSADSLMALVTWARSVEERLRRLEERTASGGPSSDDNGAPGNVRPES